MTTPSHEQIRDALLARRAELMARLGRIAVDVRHESEPLSADFAEQAVERENDEVLRSIGASSESELRQVNTALRRLAEGAYGVCESCGAVIETERLAALPHATRCGRCARE